MNMEDFIDRCIDLSISFSLDGDNLRIQAAPGALTTQIIAELKTNKVELIKWLKSNAKGKILPRAKTDEPLPLSFSQQRLWVIEQLESDTSHYNMARAFEIIGQMDETIVERAFSRIIERHEVLRTQFVETELGGRQVPRRDVEFKLQYIDLTDLEELQKTEQVKKAITFESHYSFDLNQDLLVRACFLRESKDKQVLLINMHHVVSDGWSMGILFNEFITLYQAFSENKVDPLEPLEVQYADYALWQREEFEGDLLQEQLAYWKTRLNGLPQLHNLPLDKALFPAVINRYSILSFITD